MPACLSLNPGFTPVVSTTPRKSLNLLFFQTPQAVGMTVYQLPGWTKWGKALKHCQAHSKHMASVSFFFKGKYLFSVFCKLELWHQTLLASSAVDLNCQHSQTAHLTPFFDVWVASGGWGRDCGKHDLLCKDETHFWIPTTRVGSHLPFQYSDGEKQVDWWGLLATSLVLYSVSDHVSGK